MKRLFLSLTLIGLFNPEAFAGFCNLSLLLNFGRLAQLEEHKECGREYVESDIRFETQVIRVRQDASSVTATAKGPNGIEDVRADFLIGADGARSTIRKALDIEFEGYTWPERFLMFTVMDDFQQMLGCCYRNYFADPQEWVNLFKVAGDDCKGRRRVCFPAQIDEADDHALRDEAIHGFSALFQKPDHTISFIATCIRHISVLLQNSEWDAYSLRVTLLMLTTRSVGLD